MIGVLHASIGQVRKALPVQVSHRFIASSAVFDDDHLVSCAGLVPVMTLAAPDGPAAVVGRQGSDPGTEDQIRVGQSVSEVDDRDRRHVCWRGQH